jgi:hypothetical protein
MVKITRNHDLLHKAVIVDGFAGCGKTMLSPIISAFTSVEIMQYAPVIEQMCELWGLDRIDDDVAESMIKMNADLLIYNVMMGRNSNCRPSDLSSIFRHRPLEHIKRMLNKGDKLIPEIIADKKPILHLTTHMLLPNKGPLLKALGEKLVFIEVVRHPLYMIIQHEKNMQMISDPRIQHIRYTLNKNEYAFFCDGWEDTYDKSNSFEQAIYSNHWYYSKLFSEEHTGCIIIPFEKFVQYPDKYMAQIASALERDVSANVRKVMKQQKVPRKLLCDGPALDIYKRCGWTPPSSFSEERELEVRRDLVAKNVSAEALAILDDMSVKYTATYLAN